jgi:hypothetical protein
LFHDVFGLTARSFRAGRFGIGRHSLGALESFGYQVESSVTPFVNWGPTENGEDLDFVGAPTQPYRPDPIAPQRAGRARMLEVPVTIRPHRFGALPLVGRRLPARWLRPTFSGPRELVAIAREEIAATRSNDSAGCPVVLNAMFHNVEVVPDASPYAPTEGAALRILDRLEALLEFARAERIRTVGLCDVAELFS